jgi:hypothetical protein
VCAKSIDRVLAGKNIVDFHFRLVAFDSRKMVVTKNKGSN